MSVKKLFAVNVNNKTYRISLDEGMELVQRMDTNPYHLSLNEIACAEKFENYFLELKRQNKQRYWGVVHPPRQNT